MEFLDKQIENYISAHSDKEPQILADLNRETWAKVLMPRMLSGHIQGRVLSLFSNLLRPLNIIEIGTYTGYSALCLAEGIKKEGELHTIEINEEHALIAEKYFKKSKFSKNIKQHIGNALEIIPKINKKFQLAFIDADKENYSRYFDLIVEKIDVNGIIIADNVLWSGKVIQKNMDDETKALNNYNKKVLNDSRVENILLSVRDGLMICRKK
ncbi:MAG: O-methyltransferase [Flavobacteriales bacterium]|nr:O-methyltransferase [Flavobacteriales bacterium]